MNEFVEYLKEVKSKINISSDTQFALRVGVTQSYMQKVMTGAHIPSDEICVRIADLAKDNPEDVLLRAHQSKASEKTKPYWDKILKAMTSKAAAFAILLTFSLTGPALAAPVQEQKGFDTLYIMSSRLKRRFLAFIQGLLKHSLVPACASLLFFLFVNTQPVFAEDRASWSSTDTTLELTYQVLRVMDWRQTVYITQHRTAFDEANSTLDGNMTHGNVNRYMAGLAIGHAAVSYILPPGSPRTIWQSITIVEVGAAVKHNRRIGIGMSFSF